MKRTFKFLGSVVIMVVIVLSVSACDDGSTSSSPTKFEGRWLNLAAINNFGYTDFSVTFTGNGFVWKTTGSNNSTAKGSFTFTETTITFKPASGQTWQTFTQGYTLSGNVLNLAQGGQFGFGAFTKQ